MPVDTGERIVFPAFFTLSRVLIGAGSGIVRSHLLAPTATDLRKYGKEGE
jgi:hypothetical protein